MPKPILNQKQQQQHKLSLQPSRTEMKSGQLNQQKVEQLLRKRRSKEYVEAVSKLDAGGHTCNQQQVEEILSAIENEFPEISLQGMLVGCVAECYLGPPYEVHTLDFRDRIIQHYKGGESLPDPMEKVRGLARRGGYAFIEVYTHCARAVGTDGSVSVIPL